MNAIKLSGYMATLAFAALAGGGLEANAAITMNLVDPSTYSTVVNSEYIGIYQFDTTANGGDSSVPLGNFYSICLSPLGVLADFNSHDYTRQDFQTAAPGLNGPANWAGYPDADWGIQNAQYLWKVLGSASTALTGIVTDKQSQGAGLTGAMYQALYNSTAYGMFTLNLNYNPGLTGAALSDMSADLLLLNQVSSSAAVQANKSAGFVLDPVDPTKSGPSGQEFIILAPNGQNLVPAPEPATMGLYAGSALLAIAACGALRKRRA